MAAGTCAVDNCGYAAKHRGWCRAHYDRWRKHGDPTAGRPVVRTGMSEPERFWLKVAKGDAASCWPWRGAVIVVGYGVFPTLRSDGRRLNEMAHRYAYEQVIGPIGDGLQIDHLCRNRLCVNPAHLEPVTPRTNTFRADTITRANAAKTHCPRGHAYDEENTRYVVRRRDGSLYRECRQCGREKAQRRRASGRPRER